MSPISQRIHELAVPKGKVAAICELCGKKATMKCEDCKLTHYCSEYHKTIDFRSLHQTICSRLHFLRREHYLPFTEEDRQKVNDSLTQCKEAVMSLAEISTKTWLLHENAEYAYPSAITTMNMAKDLHGDHGIGVIYPTCLVAEAYLGLNQLKVAESYMNLANWISQKYKKIPALVMARLKRLNGLACMKLQKWTLAKENFAECVYALAMEYGISSLWMGVGYGHLGLVLLHFDNLDGAVTCFHKMADLWLEFLLNQYENQTMRDATEEEIARESNVRELEFQFRESRIVFKWAYETVRRLEVSEATDRINFKFLCISALSWTRTGLPEEAIVYKQEALATATRTKQDKAVPKHREKALMSILGDDYILRWEKKHNRPRTVATKYLEMIKNINV